MGQNGVYLEASRVSRIKLMIDCLQEVEVYFVPTTQPTLMTVKVVPGNFPVPLVMNPGVWSISIQNTQNLFLVSLMALFKICV